MNIAITLAVAILAYLLLVAITGSTILGIVAAIVILIAGVPAGSYR